MITAVLFDLDGTLVDTETLSAESWRRVADEMGFTIDDETIYSFIGLTRPVIIERYGDKLGGHDRADAAFDRHYEIKFELAETDLHLMPGAEEALRTLSARGFKLGLATSSMRDVAERELAPFGLMDIFDASTCGTEAPASKPNPDIYLVTAEKLGVDPACCAVVEDSFNGVRAGHAAGMQVFLVPDLVAPTPEIQALCAEQLESLDELPAAIERWNSEGAR
ncbi:MULTISPECIES: HAD family hydrolase [Enorma]|uniref:HAD family hydrolase n=1 Tax=Enorma TaxID=1472762 RepID=UPI00034910AE|nr:MULTISPECIES: HAD family phosphatase [Enorma]